VPKNKLPPEVIKQWPEIFSDVEIKAVPIEYIHSVHVYFHDGKVWEIDMDKTTESMFMQDGEDVGVGVIEHSLEVFLTEYNEEISHVDFRLNTAKVVSDVKKRTKTFMKKRK
jgi:hypothetical protein|tara:strand:+ start:607 stop:942 length:336 start_codon:yes stop_codon:yes gene_type:complete